MNIHTLFALNIVVIKKNCNVIDFNQSYIEIFYNDFFGSHIYSSGYQSKVSRLDSFSV